MVSKSKKGKRIQFMGYYDPECIRELMSLSKALHGRPQADLLREALRDLLEKYARELRKAK
jgi:hypothetical protein